MSGPRPAAITSHCTSPSAIAVGELHGCRRPTRSPRTNVSVWIAISCLLAARARRPSRCRRPRSGAPAPAPRTAAPRSRAAHTPEAISEPEAPAPTTASDFGSCSSAHASSVPITRPSNAAPGIGRLTEPVASTIVLAAISVGPVDRDLAGSDQRAAALDQIDLVLLEQPGDAAGQRLDHSLRRRAVIAGVVDLGFADLDPEFVGLPDLGQTTSATRSTALAGMHA